MSPRGIERSVVAPLIMAVFIIGACAAPLPERASAPVALARAPAPPRPLTASGRALGERRFAHDTFVTAVAFSPDGTRLATGSMDGVVRVFDLEGRELERRALHRDTVHFVGYLGDGTLVSAGEDRLLRIGEIALACSRVPSVAVSALRVAWTPDASSVAVFEPGGELGRVDLPGVSCVALSPTGERVAAVSSSLASVWDVGGSTHVTRPLRGRRAPDGLVFLDEARLGVRYDDKVYAVPAGRLRDLDEDPEPVIAAHQAQALALAPDGTRAAAWVGGDADSIQGFVSIERVAHQPIATGVPVVRAVIALSPDGRIVAVASCCGVALLDTRTGDELPRPLAPRSAIAEIAVEGTTVTCVGQDGSVIACSTVRGDAARLVERVFHPCFLSRSPGGPFVRLDGAALRLGVEATATSLSPGGRQVAIGSRAGSLRVLDRESGAEIRCWNVGGWVQRIGFSLDGGELAVLANGKLRRAELGTGEHWGSDAECVGFGATAAGLVWAERVLDVLLVMPARVRLEDQGELAVFSPDGELVALGGATKIPVCETRTGRRVALLEGHRRGVTALAFSEDGARLASGDASGALWLWELRRGP